MDEQFIQAHAQCMAHPKKPAGKPLRRCLALFFNGAWAKLIPLRFLRDLSRALLPEDGYAIAATCIGATALIHTQ